MQHYILCHPEDISAQWAYEMIKKKGNVDIEMVNATEIPFSKNWNQQISFTGIHSSVKTGGKIINNHNSGYILNRVMYINTMLWQKAEKTESEYAAQEMFSYFVSWLEAFEEKIINKPAMNNLTGNYYDDLRVKIMATKAGLPVKKVSYNSDLDTPRDENLTACDTEQLLKVMVFENNFYGDLTDPLLIREAVSLVSNASLSLAGIDFTYTTDGKLCFDKMTPMPDLRIGGEKFIDHIIQKITTAK